MKVIVLFLFIFSLSCFAKVEFKASKVHGLVKFIELLGEDHPEYWKLIDKKQKDYIRERVSMFNDIKTRHLMGGFSTGAQNYKGKTGGNVWNVITWQSILSNNVQDFNERLTGLMTIHTQEKLISLISEFEVYYEPFWLKNKKYIQDFIKKADPILNKSTNTSSIINSIRKFYGTTWPENKPFPVGLYLVPSDTKVTGATSFDTFEEAAIKPGEDLFNRVGVIVHEMCHSYYANQDMKLFKEMKKYYDSSKSPFSHHTYHYMNESLATVLGNGIFYEKMSGKIDGNWYNDRIIDGFAHALQPITLKYLNSNSTMDQEYFSSSIQLFKKTFPNMNKRLKYLLNKPLFSVSGEVNLNSVKQPLFKKLKIQGYRTSAPFIHKYTREYYDGDKIPLILIIDESGIKNIGKIKKVYPEIASQIETIINKKKGWGYFFYMERFHLIVKFHNQKQYLSVLEKIKAVEMVAD